MTKKQRNFTRRLNRLIRAVRHYDSTLEYEVVSQRQADNMLNAIKQLKANLVRSI